MILIDTQKEEFTKLKDIRIFEKLDNEQRYNGDLLVIGLGGMGSQVVCDMKGMLMGEITPDDNIQYLMVDSDIPAMENMIEASRDGIGLNATEIISIYRPNLENLLVRGIKENPVHPNLANWMREDFPQINIDTDGAKGNRQICVFCCLISLRRHIPVRSQASSISLSCRASLAVQVVVS